MSSINLFKVEENKILSCIEYITEKQYDKIKVITKDNLEFTLYIKNSNNDKKVAWAWLLKEFKVPPIKVKFFPSAILTIKSKQTHYLYIATFGYSYFLIDKFCDREFGFNVASRLEFDDIKTTTLTAPNLSRNKTINSFREQDTLIYDSGESFAKLKVNVKLDENFDLFKPTIEAGTSIRFNMEKVDFDSISKLIVYIEEVLRIPDNQIKNKLPLFAEIKNTDFLNDANSKLDSELLKIINGETIKPNLTVPEIEVIGTREIIRSGDEIESELKLGNKSSMPLESNITLKSIKEFCENNDIQIIDDFNKIKLNTIINGNRVNSKPLRTLFEYIDDENKCIYINGKWYFFNRDFIDYLNQSISEIDAFYNKEFDLSNKKHKKFIEDKYTEIKNNTEYSNKTEEEVKTSLRNKYYAEFYFNSSRDESKFENKDRILNKYNIEEMDLYEKETDTMFAVKIGSSSSILCYAVDQSLASIEMIKQGELHSVKPKNAGLWFILEKKKKLPIDKNNKVDLSDLNMMVLKIKIDNWRKKVLLSNLKPVIYINYRVK